MIDDASVSSETITIHAPAEIVWKVLVDFEHYGLWNSFCPQIVGKLELGAPLQMKVDLGSGLQDQVEYISRIEPNHIIVWSMENKPGDPIHADRTQRITAIDENTCSYQSIDEFSGEAVGPMLAALGEVVESGFNRCAQGLKQRAEAIAAPGP